MTQQAVVPFDERGRSRLASFDGEIHVELSRIPVHYHICSWDAIETDCHMLAMSVCRIACATADAVRGRPVPAPIRRYLSEPCLRKLANVSALLDYHLQSHPDLKISLKRPPAIPMLINGTFTSAKKLDAVVMLALGKTHYWVTLVFEQTGSRWVCNHADMG